MMRLCATWVALAAGLLGCTGTNLTVPTCDGPCPCMDDTACSGATPRCDRNSGACVACLPVADNCPTGRHCVVENGSFVCEAIDRGGADAAIDLAYPRDSGVSSDSGVAGDDGGGCGDKCVLPNAQSMCVNGACAIVSCGFGYADCDGESQDGCEASLETDIANCGMCGKSCVLANAVSECTKGACAVGACDPGFGDCDGMPGNGCETAIAGDEMNCGACGHVCGGANAVEACQNSLCAVTSCTSGFGDCDHDATNGCETALASDHANCGACGNTCPSNAPKCVSGACTGLRVGIMDGCMFQCPFNDAPRAFLAAQPGIKLAARVTSCDPAILGSYDVIIVWAATGPMICYDETAFDQFAQQGGGLVGTAWIYQDYYDVVGDPPLDSMPIVPMKPVGWAPAAPLKVAVMDPNDVLLQGVTLHAGDPVGYEDGPLSVRPGVTASVVWQSDPSYSNDPAVAKWSYGSGRGVYLNFSYEAWGIMVQTAIQYSWGQQLLYNSVLWAGGAL